MMRIVIVISSLTCGGAEKNVAMLANYWSSKGYTISIVTLDSSNNIPFFYLDPKICLNQIAAYKHSESFFSAISNNFQRVFKLRSIFSKIRPNLILSFMDRTNVLALLAAFCMQIPVIVSDRNDPARKNPGRIWSILRSWTYPLANQVVVQTIGFVEFYSSSLWKKIAIIPNAIEKPPIQELGDRGDIPSPAIISIGKLKFQKGFDVLISSFALLKEKLPAWSLVIFGEGDERLFLQSLISKYSLEKSVHLMGQTRAPYFYLRHSNIFVLTSRYEGFPNVLCEAMACGLPVITTNCSPAIDEIVDHESNGFIVGSEAEVISDNILLLVNNSELRERVGENAKRIVEKFELETISRKWENLFINHAIMN